MANGSSIALDLSASSQSGKRPGDPFRFTWGQQVVAVLAIRALLLSLRTQQLFSIRRRPGLTAIGPGGWQLRSRCLRLCLLQVLRASVRSLHNGRPLPARVGCWSAGVTLFPAPGWCAGNTLSGRLRVMFDILT